MSLRSLLSFKGNLSELGPCSWIAFHVPCASARRFCLWVPHSHVSIENIFVCSKVHIPVLKSSKLGFAFLFYVPPKKKFGICKTWLHSKELKRLYSANTLPLPFSLPHTHLSPDWGFTGICHDRITPCPVAGSQPHECVGGRRFGYCVPLLHLEANNISPSPSKIPGPLGAACKHSIFLHRSAKVMFLFIRVLHSCKKFAFLRS